MSPQPPAGPPQPPPGPQGPPQEPQSQEQPEAEYVPVENWTPEPVFDSADYLDRADPVYLDEGTEEETGEEQTAPSGGEAPAPTRKEQR